METTVNHQQSVRQLAMVRVLVIEDSHAQVRVIQEMLANDRVTEFSVSDASDLASGLTRLGSGTFDAILLDLTLPDSRGIESYNRLSTTAKSIPIVVLTDMDDEDLAIKTLQEGAEDYLVKGDINSQLLSRAIRYSIERKRSMLQLQAANDELESRVEERTRELRQLQAEAVERQEELAHASRLNTLGEMASGLAHELNQPLMAIIGYTDHCVHLLESDQMDAELCTETLRNASKEATRAGQIIKRMRRLVSKREPQREFADLNQTVEETVQLLSPGLELNVRMDFDDSLPKIKIDRVQIQQVVLNLAQNAVQAMDHGDAEKHELTLRTGHDDDQEMLFVEVADTGPGLAPEYLERLFDPFFTRTPNGLGLGLSISRSIVESHGGNLTVSQNSRHGLTFRFVLPDKNEPSA